MSKTTLFKAFPLGNQVSAWQDGMDLRDYFAAHALVGYLSHVPYEKIVDPSKVSKIVYSFADAMMEARYDTK